MSNTIKGPICTYLYKVFILCSNKKKKNETFPSQVEFVTINKCTHNEVDMLDSTLKKS